MADTTQSQETDNDEEQREEFAWASQQPTSAITGTFEGLIYSGQLNSDVAQNGTSFGVIFGNPEIDGGTLFRNEAKPSDDLVRSTLDEDQSSPTDYRIVGTEDDSVTIRDGILFTQERNAATYEGADAFDEDSVIVWYNGVSGGRIGRVLDFNGLPFAEYKEDGYLVKGLVQVADGWREPSRRRELARSDRAPRVVRAPIPREDVIGEEITVEISRPENGQYYHATVLDADGEELEMVYNEDADEVIEEAEYRMHMHHGSGFADRPATAPPEFGIQPDNTDGTAVDGLTVTQQAFVEQTAQALEQYGQTPEEAFNGGIAGLMQRHGVEGDSETIERAVYTQASHLDEDSL